MPVDNGQQQIYEVADHYEQIGQMGEDDIGEGEEEGESPQDGGDAGEMQDDDQYEDQQIVMGGD